MQRTYKSGDVIEKTRFWFRGPKVPRGPRKAKTGERHQERNDRSAVRKAARILNVNFREGVLVKLGMDEEHYQALAESCGGDRTAMAAEYRHRVSLFLLRWKRAAKKRGEEIGPYWGAICDKDHKGRPARIHAHLVIRRGEYAEIEKLWGQGKGLGWEPLSSRPDRTELAAYVMKQAARIGTGVRVIAARGMDQPIVTEELIADNREIRLPAGAVECERSAYSPDAAQYVRYIRRTIPHPPAQGAGTFPQGKADDPSGACGASFSPAGSGRAGSGSPPEIHSTPAPSCGSLYAREPEEEGGGR